ncbi:hypothetical protein HPB47_000995 [Ixodes persulcatus]|uniref:Uncharacterized protein n=1 Tax=Ixodes persulcatus TaxID=34615 RepID=A0AC60R0A9_IXOPE|nr:hypothetical protein HPB47_000995 [Ixodes persulcatus]
MAPGAAATAPSQSSWSSGSTPSIDIGGMFPLFKWPDIRAPQIIYYLLHTKACDMEDVKAYKSLDSYNYLKSGWVGAVLVHEVDQGTSVNRTNNVWVCAKKDGEVITGGCTCMAGKAQVCSHVGAVLWKVDFAASAGLTGQMCTDAAMKWNQGTKQNVVPAALHSIGFKLRKGIATDTDTHVPGPKRIHAFSDDRELQEFHSTAPFQGLFCIPGKHRHLKICISLQLVQHLWLKAVVFSHWWLGGPLWAGALMGNSFHAKGQRGRVSGDYDCKIKDATSIFAPTLTIA